MSKISIKGADTGTGVFTLESPATNTNRTLTIPDVDGSIVTADASGNVGIGTSSPGYKLDVNGAAAIRAGNLLFSFNSDNTNSTYIYNPGATGAGNGSFAFGIVGQGEQMRLTSTGLGIGTTSPTQKLDVAGTVKATAFVGDGSALTGIAGGVTSLNGQTGAITNTGLNVIGSYVGSSWRPDIPAGDTVAGSNLSYAYYNGTWSSPSFGATGTWRFMGGIRHISQSPTGYHALFVRVS